MDKEFRFPNEDKARGFVEGVEFVNDSAIEVKALEKEGEEWVVLLHDSDARE
jgi:hypothetical protein